MEYGAPVSLEPLGVGEHTIKAIAAKDDAQNSAIASRTFRVSPPMPTFGTDSGSTVTRGAELTPLLRH